MFSRYQQVALSLALVLVLMGLVAPRLAGASTSVPLVTHEMATIDGALQTLSRLARAPGALAQPGPFEAQIAAVDGAWPEVKMALASRAAKSGSGSAAGAVSGNFEAQLAALRSGIAAKNEKQVAQALGALSASFTSARDELARPEVRVGDLAGTSLLFFGLVIGGVVVARVVGGRRDRQLVAVRRQSKMRKEATA